MCDHYERIMLCDLKVAQSNDIDSRLWSNVFYSVVEQLRKNFSNQPNKKNSKVSPELEEFVVFAEVFYVNLVGVFSTTLLTARTD